MGASKDPGTSHFIDLTNLIAKATRIAAAQILQKDLEMGTECMVDDGLEASGSEILQEM